MWDATPIDLPLDAYDGPEPFDLFVGFPGPHDPWDAPREAVARYDGVDVPLPASMRAPDLGDAGTYGRLLDAFLRLSDNATVTPDRIRAMRRAYHADVTVIDEAVGRSSGRSIVAAPSTTRGSSTRATTGRWPGTTACSRSASSSTAR